MIYQVWSMHDGVEKPETRRIDKKDAELDVSLIKGIMHRQAWIQEVNESPPVQRRS